MGAKCLQLVNNEKTEEEKKNISHKHTVVTSNRWRIQPGKNYAVKFEICLNCKNKKQRRRGR